MFHFPPVVHDAAAPAVLFGRARQAFTAGHFSEALTCYQQLQTAELPSRLNSIICYARVASSHCDDSNEEKKETAAAAATDVRERTTFDAVLQRVRDDAAAHQTSLDMKKDHGQRDLAHVYYCWLESSLSAYQVLSSGRQLPVHANPADAVQRSRRESKLKAIMLASNKLYWCHAAMVGRQEIEVDATAITSINALLDECLCWLSSQTDLGTSGFAPRVCQLCRQYQDKKLIQSHIISGRVISLVTGRLDAKLLNTSSAHGKALGYKELTVPLLCADCEQKRLSPAESAFIDAVVRPLYPSQPDAEAATQTDQKEEPYPCERQHRIQPTWETSYALLSLMFRVLLVKDWGAWPDAHKIPPLLAQLRDVLRDRERYHRLYSGVRGVGEEKGEHEQTVIPAVYEFVLPSRTALLRDQSGRTIEVDDVMLGCTFDYQLIVKGEASRFVYVYLKIGLLVYLLPLVAGAVWVEGGVNATSPPATVYTIASNGLRVARIPDALLTVLEERAAAQSAYILSRGKVRDESAPSRLPKLHQQAIVERDRGAPAMLQNKAFAQQLLWLPPGYQAVPAAAGTSFEALVRRMQAGLDITLPVQHRWVSAISMAVWVDASGPPDVMVVTLIVRAAAAPSRYLLLSRVSQANHITWYCAATVAVSGNGLMTASVMPGPPPVVAAMLEGSVQQSLQADGLRKELQKHGFI
jgi:hypothetical protein